MKVTFVGLAPSLTELEKYELEVTQLAVNFREGAARIQFVGHAPVTVKLSTHMPSLGNIVQAGAEQALREESQAIQAALRNAQADAAKEGGLGVVERVKRFLGLG